MMTGVGKDVIIIGAGLAGLAAALTLEKNGGVDYLLLDSASCVGGRVVSERQDGFILDRGFQIFLTEYPEAKRFLDYARLDLKPFYKGALIWDGKNFSKVADPFRHPLDSLGSLFNDVGTPADKLRVAQLRQALVNSAGKSNFETSTQAYLEAESFSPSMIERLFRPFFSGIFLEKELATSSRLFAFLFKMFALGDATLPAQGIQAIPEQMAEKIPLERIHLNAVVSAIEPVPNSTSATAKQLRLRNGELLTTKAVILATDAASARELLPHSVSDRHFNGTCCLYYETETPPVDLPALVLNSVPGAIINNLCVPSLVSPSYAPGGKHLVSVSTVGETEIPLNRLESLVRQELLGMFGNQVSLWRLLKIDVIPHALPRSLCGEMPAWPDPEHSRSMLDIQSEDGVYLAGDYRTTPSLNGALASGRHAAELVLGKQSLASSNPVQSGSRD